MHIHTHTQAHLKTYIDTYIDRLDRYVDAYIHTFVFLHMYINTHKKHTTRQIHRHMNTHIHGDTHKTYFSSVKSFNKLLLNRQRFEPLMRSNQSGFRPSKNHIDTDYGPPKSFRRGEGQELTGRHQFF